MVDIIGLGVQLAVIVGGLVVVSKIFVSVTRHITNIEGSIKTECPRLDGTINELVAE